MSYWVSLVRNLDGQEYEVFEVGNYTSNVSEMWRRALEAASHDGGLASLSGKVADTDMLATLYAARNHMRNVPQEYRELEPASWGTYEGALEYLEKLLLGCRLHPFALIRVSH